MLDKRFVLAGDAIFTVKTPAKHYTYRVTRKEATDRWPETWFVKMLSGPDNLRDYTYMGKLVDGQLQLTAKSAYPAEAYCVRLLNRAMARVWQGAADLAPGYDIIHAGRCGRCGRTLTTPLSLERGIGPECWEIMGSSGFVSDGLSTEGLTPERDAEGEILAWSGVRDGRECVVYND